MAGNGYRILLPTDGSYPAIAATVRAMEMAKDRNGKVVILRVAEQVIGAGMERIAEDSALMRTAGIDGIAYAKEIMSKNNVPFDVVLREGAVVGEIVRTAAESEVDIIVMGSSTIKGLPGLYLGSVSRGVIKEAPCDVVVVKLTEQEMHRAVEMALQFAIGQKAPTPINGAAELFKTRQFKVGLGLFTVYVVGYAIFTIVGTFSKLSFAGAFGGMNVGVYSGIILIITAIVMAVGFNWYAGKKERGSGGG
ncbi:MAG TPA: universal stress protein [Methanomassiliicoccales archaeon]|nr:universal stress protein [Methanomassiliicoccales archaeon]